MSENTPVLPAFDAKNNKARFKTKVEPQSEPLDETVYYHSDREQIKEGRCNPADIRGYIEALETIAKIAYRVWCHSGSGYGLKEHADIDNLYDVLAKVDWMTGDGE